MLDYLVISDKTKIAVDELGESWSNFESLLTPETALLFNTSYNLITIGVKECSLPLDITNTLINEGLDTSSLISSIRQIFLVYLTDVLGTMGILIDKDQVDSDSLPYLNNILNVIYALDDVDDVMGLIFILENHTFTNKDKLVEIIIKLYDLDDEDQYPNLIFDVSADVIKGLLIGLGALTIDDSENYVDANIANRIKANKTFLEGTIAEKHIKDGGGIGLSYEAISNLYINDIAKIMVENPIKYYKEIIGILIISSLTDVEIESGYEGMVKDFANDLTELHSASRLIEEVVIK